MKKSNEKTIISNLIVYNDRYVTDKETAKADGRKFRSMATDIDRISRARGSKTALGIFGPSQCGKSYLTSELFGGVDTKLVIPGVEGATFQKYNQTNIDREATGVVTRLTQAPNQNDIPKGNVFVRYMTPADIMWSFAYGFYNEMQWSKGFNLDEDQL